MQAAEERPPYVKFETRAVEDRNGSIAAGHYVARDEDYALITPQGSKDVVERVVTEWFDNLVQQVAQQRFPQTWLTGYRSHYEAWKKGEELPVDGHPVKLWTVASPSQILALLNAKCRTVEDLAGANEETLARIGMGSRALKQRAVEWLESSKSVGQQSERIAALEAEKADQKAQLDSQALRLAELEKQLAGLTKK
jgi:hypothetical protein